MQKETSKNSINLSGLYLVSTPIGNLKDITLRALEVLSLANIIICEDTRITRKLLSHYNILGKKLISYGKHNLNKVTNKIILQLKANQAVALVSDAGTPLISDPGAELIAECYKNNIKVTVIPGASAVISAITLSGINNKSFYFGGFLENKATAIKKQLQQAKAANTTMIFFVAANKLLKALEGITSTFGHSQQVVIARELTKVFEEIIVDSAANLIEMLQTQKILGEIVLLLPYKQPESTANTNEITAFLTEALQQTSLKDAIALTINYYSEKSININKKELYNLAINLKKHENKIK